MKLKYFHSYAPLLRWSLPRVARLHHCGDFFCVVMIILWGFFPRLSQLSRTYRQMYCAVTSEKSKHKELRQGEKGGTASWPETVSALNMPLRRSESDASQEMCSEI